MKRRRNRCGASVIGHVDRAQLRHERVRRRRDAFLYGDIDTTGDWTCIAGGAALPVGRPKVLRRMLPLMAIERMIPTWTTMIGAAMETALPDYVLRKLS